MFWFVFMKAFASAQRETKKECEEQSFVAWASFTYGQVPNPNS
jgi:hypothetical protein